MFHFSSQIMMLKSVSTVLAWQSLWSWFKCQMSRRYMIWPAAVVSIFFILTLVASLGSRLSYISCQKEMLSGATDLRKISEGTAHLHTIIERKGSEIHVSNSRLSERQGRVLRRAKLAIETISPTKGLDNLYDDKYLYHNISKFRRSFDVMQRVFRIYVYREGYRPLIHEGPKSGIYASEGLFIESMERKNPFLVKDPRVALMFYIPFSLKQMVDYMYDPNARSMKNIQIYIANYVSTLAVKYPYLNRTNGADHFFVSCHDWALRALDTHEQLRGNAVKVVCNADSSQGFDIERDVSLPETRIQSSKRNGSSLGGVEPSERPYLAFFAGQMHGKLRPLLLKHWRDKDPLMKIYGVLPAAVARNMSYTQHMKLSKYCICAAGFEVNSPRLVEAMMYECVPVIIADYFVLPFSDVINWESISVSVAEKDVPKLKQILTSIPEDRYRAMQGRLKHVRQHFLWNEVPRKYDIFSMIIHSLWTQQLNSVSL